MLLILADFSREQFCLEGLFWQNQNAFLFEGCNWTGPTWIFDLKKWSGPSFWQFSSIHPSAKIIPKSSVRKTCRVRHYLKGHKAHESSRMRRLISRVPKIPSLASSAGKWATFPKVANEVLEAMSKRNSEELGGLKSGVCFSQKKRFSVCFEKEKVEWATVFFFKKRHKNRGIYDMRTKKLGEVRELLETWNHNSPQFSVRFPWFGKEFAPVW